ncbi:XRE family transcriptional regulator [Kribbella antibiotica]|uniref:XRE family transcriptional regulator n=1 Tax=Kribbella antibiotica TaxID=190195 RepID=A0A4V6PDU2_9ACTN|nr:helix-turn-helix transcriptional regulator [Kribbella antibiotica]TDD46207.1 XRE family transcriptional regulator [Kribbella antibiotica]
MTTTASNQLGDFLRAQRARLTPQDAGLVTTGSRRVAGLRREEVAVLSGVSADYYTRLEQGRERTPSAQVVDSICRALQLEADARGHLFRLARLSPYADQTAEAIAPELLQTMESFAHAAAYVTNPALRVLVANPAAERLISPLQRQDQNVLAALFVDPYAKEFYGNWDEIVRASVSALRLAAGFSPLHPEVSDLVARLYRDSELFRSLWDDQSVAGLSVTQKTIHHPEAGKLELSYQTFDVRSAPGQQLTVATAASGSRSAEVLASWV